MAITGIRICKVLKTLKFARPAIGVMGRWGSVYISKSYTIVMRAILCFQQSAVDRYLAFLMQNAIREISTEAPEQPPQHDADLIEAKSAARMLGWVMILSIIFWVTVFAMWLL